MRKGEGTCEVRGLTDRQCGAIWEVEGETRQGIGGEKGCESWKVVELHQEAGAAGWSQRGEGKGQPRQTKRKSRAQRQKGEDGLLAGRTAEEWKQELAESL